MRALLACVMPHAMNIKILRESLQLSNDRWVMFVTDVCKALKPDNFARCWSCPLEDVQLHVLFGCESGNVRFCDFLSVNVNGTAGFAT